MGSRRDGRFHDFGTFRRGDTVVSIILLMFMHMSFSSRRNDRFHIIERFAEAIWPFPACRPYSDDRASRRGETVVFTTFVRFVEAIWPFPACRSCSGNCVSCRGETVVFAILGVSSRQYGHLQHVVHARTIVLLVEVKRSFHDFSAFRQGNMAISSMS